MNYSQIAYVRGEIKHIESIIDWFVFEAQEFSNQESCDKILNMYESQLKAWKKELELLLKK